MSGPALTFTVDEPPALGGADVAANPVQYALASLGSCRAITYRFRAEQLQSPHPAGRAAQPILLHSARLAHGRVGGGLVAGGKNAAVGGGPETTARLSVLQTVTARARPQAATGHDGGSPIRRWRFIPRISRERETAYGQLGNSTRCVTAMSVTRNMALMTDIRNCEQCGTLFLPRREHARFCSARCRVAWNRENAGDRSAGVSALDWSIAAMREATGRLVRARAWERPRAFAVVSESVWWVTIVDGTLMRYHPAVYDGVLAGQAPAERQLIEETLAGLRFVRNQACHDADYVDFIQPVPGHSDPGDSRVTAWTWKSVPEPRVASLPARGQAWEMTRYRAYRAQLAGHTVGEIFGQAAAFLQLAATNATSVPDVSTHAAR
jgi:hypothetical protein